MGESEKDTPPPGPVGDLKKFWESEPEGEMDQVARNPNILRLEEKNGVKEEYHNGS